MTDIFIKFLFKEEEKEENLQIYTKDELISVIIKLKEKEKKLMAFIKNYVKNQKPMLDLLNKYNIKNKEEFEILLKQKKDDQDLVPDRHIQELSEFVKQVELKYENGLHKSLDKDSYIRKIPENIIQSENIHTKQEVVNKVSKIVPERHKNMESHRILKIVKKNYYEFCDKLLPKTSNIENFGDFNKNIKIKYMINVKNIIVFYKIYKNYLDNHIFQSCIDESENTFNEYIKYNNFEYSKKYFSNFFSKVKKCYYFIKFLIDKGVQENKIIKLLYKTNISYTKLFKIKNEDYEELKLFFIEKLEILNLLTKDIKDKSPITSVSLNLGERTTKKHTLLSYIGTKHDYIPLIKDMLCIKKDTKIYDLFAGSCGISYELNAAFPKNKIIINDISTYIINFYYNVKNNCKNLVEKINILNTDENIKNYENLLNIINDPDIIDIDKAATYYILNKIAYNGKVFVKNGRISIYSYIKNKININSDKFYNFSSFLNKIEINNKCILKDYNYYLEQINEGDVIIIDPPYDILDLQNDHYIDNFTRDDQEKLFIFIEKLLQKKAQVLIFNGNTLFIKKLYKNYNINIIESKTRINKNNCYNELLIHNIYL